MMSRDLMPEGVLVNGYVTVLNRRSYFIPVHSSHLDIQFIVLLFF